MTNYTRIGFIPPEIRDYIKGKFDLKQGCGHYGYEIGMLDIAKQVKTKEHETELLSITDLIADSVGIDNTKTIVGYKVSYHPYMIKDRDNLEHAKSRLLSLSERGIDVEFAVRQIEHDLKKPEIIGETMDLTERLLQIYKSTS